ncbi:CLIP domain-containing serine protease C9-like [Anopheles coustani]|uniref:CLIP domain-containing serine protease C9-like n=1 Tax=Anopheles coustani TaxID=139045 RepID=UPI0026581EFF|nr:CLIP domain-containing serine protease C9-like [Anopheles coustani]
MKEEECDQAFVNGLPFDAHDSNCRQNPFTHVLCCEPFLNYCKNKVHPHIIGGEEAPPDSFPHLARIGNKDDGIRWKCSSSIISDQFLLTAAHCLSADVAGLGCTSAKECNQVIDVEKFIKHPRYGGRKKYNDIALVRLKKKITFNSHVRPICPYNKMDDLDERVTMTIAGWGDTETGSPSPTLRFAHLETVPLISCNASYAPLVQTVLRTKFPEGITNTIYCAQGSFVEEIFSYKDACQGDSGGLLQAPSDNYPVLVGVISTGMGCGGSNPGIYTRVAAYFDWIKKTVGEF